MQSAHMRRRERADKSLFWKKTGTQKRRRRRGKCDRESGAHGFELGQLSECEGDGMKKRLKGGFVEKWDEKDEGVDWNNDLEKVSVG